MIDKEYDFMDAILEEKLKEMHNFNYVAHEQLSYCIVDENLNIQNVSKACVDVLGYKEDNLRNKNFVTIVQNESVSKLNNGCEYVKNANAEHIKEPKIESWGTELVLTSVTNHEIFTNVIIFPTFYEDMHSGFILVIEDITSKKYLHKLQLKMFADEKLDRTSLDFVSTASAAVLDTISYKISLVVKIIVSFIILFLAYASIFEIDELSRGTGKFIPTAKVQKLKNYEGGVVSDIYVEEGDNVKKGQILLRLSPISYQSKYEENNIRLFELRAKVTRLAAEKDGIDMGSVPCLIDCNENLLKLERSYFISNQKEINKNISKQKEQIKAKKSELIDSEHIYNSLIKNNAILIKEFNLKKSLEKKKIFTKFELGLLERELNDAESNLNSAKEKIVQVKNQIEEINNNIEETKLNFKNKASLQYSETLGEILRLKETQKNLEDIIDRTVIKSPVNGIIKELFVHTIGTSIESSAELLTIVPNNYEMVAEVKIKPEEIAKLFIGQSVNLKVTAFDYSIYGNLKGKITNISPDTIQDKISGENHYLVYVKTQKNYFNNNEKNKIKVGMIVNADILVGKKSIMSFLLKPILKTTQVE